MKHLILVGACYLDTILSVPHYPDEDSKLRATTLEVRRGGNCPNTAEVLQELLRNSSTITPEARDLQPWLVSSLPAAESPGASKILSSFGDGTVVRFDHCMYRQGCTEAASSYIIRSQKTGSRTIVNYNGLPEMTAGEFAAVVDAFAGEQETWWHFEGRIPETTLACIRHLRQSLPSARVSVEVEKPKREGLRELADEADAVFYSRSWAEAEGYVDPASCLARESNPKMSHCFCTWGAESAAGWEKSSLEPFTAPVVQVPDSRVVDSVGAGDTFIARVLLDLVCGGKSGESEAKRTLKEAVDLASRKIQINGFAGLE